MNQQIKSASKELLGETIDEEDMERFDSGFASTQGESIYEELDNPEHYEDLSDFDDPLFWIKKEFPSNWKKLTFIFHEKILLIHVQSFYKKSYILNKKVLMYYFF